MHTTVYFLFLTESVVYFFFAKKHHKQLTVGAILEKKERARRFVSKTGRRDVICVTQKQPRIRFLFLPFH